MESQLIPFGGLCYEGDHQHPQNAEFLGTPWIREVLEFRRRVISFLFEQAAGYRLFGVPKRRILAVKHTDSLGENITFYYTNPWGRIVGAFLKWAVRQSHIETKYAEGLAVARKATKKSEEREAYSSDDVGRLLSRGGPRNSDSRVRQKINL